jgi:hypothetical protein
MALIGSVTASILTVNEDSAGASDFRVESDNKTHALFINSHDDKVLILSGGSAHSNPEDRADDVVFYVSGANSFAQGSQGFGYFGGVSVFGGDVRVSGSFRVATAQMWEGGGEWGWDDVATKVEFGPKGSDDEGNSFVGQDVLWWASGSIGKKDDTSGGATIASFGGDLVVSGGLYLEERSEPGTIADGTVVLYGKDDNNVTKLYFKNESGETEVGSGGSGGDTFKTISVSGQSDVVADSSTDTLTLVGGSNITITTAAGTDTVTIAASTGGSLTGIDDQTSSNADQLTITDSAIIINDDSDDLDFRVETNTKTHALFIDGGNNQVLVLSGGTVDQSAPGTDAAFYVSGANSYVQGSEGFGTKGGVSVFGGDVHISGSLQFIGMGSYQGSTYEMMQVVDFGGGKYEGDDEEGGAVVGEDVIFWVSGGIGKTQDASQGGKISSFGGDLVVSGALYARQKHFMSHKYHANGTAQAYVRWNANDQNGAPGVNNKFVAPYGGKLLGVVIRSTSAAGSTAIAFHKNTNGNANLDTTATETETVNMASANTAYGVAFSDTSYFSMGNILGISVTPTTDPNDVDLTSVWEFNTFEGF